MTEKMTTAIAPMRAKDDEYEERWRETGAQTGTKAEPSMRGRGWRRCGPERLLRSTFPPHLPTVGHPPALKADSNLLLSAPPNAIWLAMLSAPATSTRASAGTCGAPPAAASLIA
jgi:hypothetical protein